MKVGVIRFPGSNCDRDVYHVLELAGAEPEYVWWDQENLGHLDAVIIPGGFSYGDYLRAGALAAASPVMSSIRRAADGGLPVLGICNGFQVLVEMGLLPGALLRNANLKYICRTVGLRVETTASDFTAGYAEGAELQVPIAHHDGNYMADAETLARLEGEGRVAFRYLANPNGSMNDIAGIVSENRRVLGMMPHPERAFAPLHGSADGRAMFDGLMSAFAPA